MPATSKAPDQGGVANGPSPTWRRPGALFALGVGAALLLALAWSVTVGAVRTDVGTVWSALTQPQPGSATHEVVRSLRLPRALTGALVGAALATAGALMQGLTRNPLASPSLMGLNAGAGLALVAAMAFWPGLGHTPLIVAGFLGALLGAAMVFGVGSLSPGGLSPVRLALAGAAVSALLAAVSTGLSLVFGLAQGLLFYSAGGVQNARWEQLALFAPWCAFGLLLALLLAPQLTVLSLGDDVAAGLGQRTGLVRVAGAAAVLALAGASVAVAGNVAFVGLVVPHLARSLVGLDYRRVVPASAALGALLLLLADVGARLLRPPFETPVGLITAVIGVPFLLFLARRDGRGM